MNNNPSDNSNPFQIIESQVLAPKFVVGVGASAGGLESLEQLFRHMPTNTGMAYVVIQHLSPDFKSMMSELLARETSIRIKVVEDGVRIEPDVIYLLPPKKEMLIADGCLHLTDKQITRGLTLPIDRFLESLAREMGDKAVAIILSGSGTDGTRGVEEVSRRGGLIISESLETATFDGMPSSVQATGLVDLVLSPAEMGKALLQYMLDPGYLLKRRFQSQDNLDSTLGGSDAIIQLFRSVYGIDFSAYKESTVLRRMRRRLAMSRVETLDEYAKLINNDPAERDAMYSDLLIGVTQFFRDPACYKFLCSDVLPELLQRNRDQGIRVWVAGCATGEEAYSIAIAIQEAMRESGRATPLKIFATDVYKRSIEHAGRGIFRKDVLKELSDDLLTRYFIERTDGYQIRPEIRQMIVFAPHNILRDAPFTDIDLVTCRNMLIYFRTAAQRRAISLLHYSLRVDGVLLLGGSETPGELSNEFSTISDRHRIYRKSRDVRLAQNLRSPLTTSEGTYRGLVATPPIPLNPIPGIKRTRQLHDELLDRFMPPSILIDSSRQVLDTFAGAEKLLHFPTRQPSFDVLDLVDRDVRTTLAGAIGKAIKSHQPVRFGKLQIKADAGIQLFHLTVEPLTGKNVQDCYLIRFDPVESTPATRSTQAPQLPEGTTTVVDSGTQLAVDTSREQMQHLEEELRYSRENLQATIEEMETSNEELQATNEELIASNEELQSTNEELHSLNEELYSVNAEHQRKIEQLAELNRDMNHLLENTDVATIFLDGELRIRRFTTRVNEIFELIEDDIGRSIHVFGSKIRMDDIIDRLHQVLSTGTAYEREIRAADGTSYLMRLLPYRPEDRINGVVMMWVNVSSLEVLRGRLRWLSAIVESTNDAIIGQDLDGTISSWNRGAEELYGYTASEILGKPISKLVPQDRWHELDEYRERILRGERVLSIDTVRLNKAGTILHVSLTVSPVFNTDQKVIGISKIARDISERIQLEAEIRNQVRLRERFLATLSHELRNPLNAVRAASGILANHQATESDRQSAIVTLGRQGNVLNHLISDLLDVARVAENRIQLHQSPFDLRAIVAEVQEIVQPELDRHHCRVKFVLPENPVIVHGDRTRLIQVHVNLIHNAAKYSETNSPIQVTMAVDASKVIVSVADQGRGIPTERLEAIFEPFVQLDRSRNHSDGGLGVGLSLSKSLIELHGGKIWAESAGEGHGSIFYISLPVQKSDQLLPNAASPAYTDDAPDAKLIAQSKPLSICIVEDLDDSRRMLKTLLELEGHRVCSANDGVSAIELLQQELPDLCLIDIGLPDISGYEVARRLRSQVATSQLKLIALTGYGQESDVKQAFAAGFDAHMIKPIDPKKLAQLCMSVADEIGS